MSVRNFVLVAAVTFAASSAFAQSHKPADNANAPVRSGSADDQAACRPDVRKFCYKLDEMAGDLMFLACLKEHRDELRKPCLEVLTKNGQ
jgi:hypothetical protein